MADDIKVMFALPRDSVHRMAMEAHDEEVTLNEYVRRTLHKRNTNGEEELEDAHD